MFGVIEIQNNQIEQPLRFAGQYHDVETGLYYNWNRYYSPELGRYVTSDPIGLWGGFNTFGYVDANPLFYSDSKGLCNCKALKDIVDYDDENGDKKTILKYNPLNNELVMPLNDPCMSIYGPVDIDWMLRVGPDLYLGDYLAWLSYRTMKFYWNVGRSMSDAYELEFNSIYDEANENAPRVGRKWVTGQSLKTLFKPALEDCGYNDESCQK